MRKELPPQGDKHRVGTGCIDPPAASIGPIPCVWWYYWGGDRCRISCTQEMARKDHCVGLRQDMHVIVSVYM